MFDNFDKIDFESVKHKKPEGMSDAFFKQFCEAESHEDIQMLTADREQMKILLNSMIDNESVEAALQLFEGVAIHMMACKAGDWEAAEEVAYQLSERCTMLAQAHRLRQLGDKTS